MTTWIDAHHHLWDLSAVSYPWLEAKGVKRFFGDPAPIQRDYLIEEFSAGAKANGFAGSVHIQVGAEDGMAEAQWVQSIASANPDWPLVQVVFCDLMALDLGDQLDQCLQLPSVRGIRQIVGRAPKEDAATSTNALLDDPKFAKGLQEVARRDLSFDLQLTPELMEKTAEILRGIPELMVALCHAGSPYDRSHEGLVHWGQSLRALSALPNVSCKLSGLGMFDHDWTIETIRPIVETCLEQFGPNRCMFGSNFPVDSLYSDYATVASAMRELVPDGLHASIFGDNAIRFYRIQLPS